MNIMSAPLVLIRFPFRSPHGPSFTSLIFHLNDAEMDNRNKSSALKVYNSKQNSPEEALAETYFSNASKHLCAHAGGLEGDR